MCRFMHIDSHTIPMSILIISFNHIIINFNMTVINGAGGVRDWNLAWGVAFCVVWGLLLHLGGRLIIWDLHGLGLLVGFGVFLASVLGGVVNSTFNMFFVAPPAHGVRLA